MGSHFIDLWLADPLEAHAIARGDRAEFFELDHPPALAPALALMRARSFLSLPKALGHPQGLLYCRAFEAVLAAIRRGRWTIECYPDESLPLLTELAFGRCEAPWLSLPHAPSGVGVIAWRSSDTALRFADEARRMRDSGEFEPRFVSRRNLTSILDACDTASRTAFGLFTVYKA